MKLSQFPPGQAASSKPLDERPVVDRENVQVFWRDDIGVPHRQNVAIVAASVSSLEFLTRLPLRQGDLLTLQKGSREVACLVRSVRDSNGMRRISVEAEAGPGRTDIAKSVQRLKQALADARRRSTEPNRR